MKDYRYRFDALIKKIFKSLKGQLEGTTHVAVPVIKGTSIIYKPSKADRAWYQNSSRTSPDCPISTHAEMALLCRLMKSLKLTANNKALSNGTRLHHTKIDILVVRFTKCGENSESRPCAECSKRIVEFGRVHDVYYSTANNIIARLKASQLVEGSYVSRGYKLAKLSMTATSKLKSS